MFGPSMRPVLQTEASECSLACLAMVAGAHGLMLDLSELRRRFSVGRRGATLEHVMSQAAALGFGTRALRADIDELADLQVPCILHWDLNHFVVLVRVRRGRAIVFDPAVGERRLGLSEMSGHFTGVALELTPDASFEPEDRTTRLRLGQLTGRVRGLGLSLAQVMAVSLVLELLALVAPLFNQLVVDDVLTSGDRSLLTVLVLGFGLLLVMQTAIGLARSWMLTMLGQAVSLQWSGNVFAHLLKLPLHYFEKRQLGDLVSRFGAVGAIQRTLTSAVIEAILDGLMAVAALGMMLVYSPLLAAIVVSAVALYGLLRAVSYRPLRDATAERLVVAAKESTYFLETLRAIAPLKLFGREHDRRSRWQNLVVEVQNRDIRTVKMNIVFSTANTFIFGVENLLVFWLAARMVIDGPGGEGGAAPFTVGMLFAFTSYKAQFTQRVSALIDYAVQLRMLGLHAERLGDIALAEPEADAPRAGAMAAADCDLSRRPASIELSHVSFRYAENEPWILRDANLRIEPGESIAVVGPSGSGKTTLLKVLLGLLEPSEGEVRYAGVPVRRLGMANVRRQVGTVMQEDILLSGCIADNISFFDARPDAEHIRRCAAIAQVHDDIVDMPMGYETLVGDLGSGLSGGQKQRILLARALYKRPLVLALDEATSHLDLPRERAVAQSLAAMAITRVVVAHRPETIATAQRVVQLLDGRLWPVERPAALPASS